MEFKAGDLVRLRSGSPVMTVEQVGKRTMTEEETVWCVWFEKVGNKQVPQRETFPPVTLERAEKRGPVTVGIARA